MQTWFGVWAPSGTPPAVVGKIYAGITAVLQTDSVRQRLVENGYQPGGAAPAAFRKFVNDETAKYGKSSKPSVWKITDRAAYLVPSRIVPMR